MNKQDKILVTGGTGFIGSHLAERLANENVAVRILAMQNPLQEIEKDTLGILRNNKNIEVAFGDIRDKNTLPGALRGINTVFHTAAISRPMNIPRKTYYDINETGTLNLLEASVKENIKKFVHISAISVLGTSPDGTPLKENDYQDEHTLDDYDLSKKRAEEIVLRFHSQYKLPVTILRPPMTYGPRCIARLTVFKHIQNRLFPLFREGIARMEFCYIDNLAQAILLAGSSQAAIGNIYNIADARPYQIREVAGEIAKQLGVELNNIKVPVFLAKFLGFSVQSMGKIFKFYHPFSHQVVDWMSYDRCVYDITKAKQELGYKPEVGLEEGIRRSIEWYKTKGLLG